MGDEGFAICVDCNNTMKIHGNRCVEIGRRVLYIRPYFNLGGLVSRCDRCGSFKFPDTMRGAFLYMDLFTEVVHQLVKAELLLIELVQESKDPTLTKKLRGRILELHTMIDKVAKGVE